MEDKKFKALEELKLTKEEALEWIEHLWKAQIVETRLALVYKKSDGRLEAYPYLDKSKKEEIVGFLINNKVWSLVEQQTDVMYYDINKACKQKLPSVPDLKDVTARLSDVNEVVTILKENGIEAEFFHNTGSYWTNQYCVINQQTAVKIYSIGTRQEYEIDPSRGKVAHVRECYPFN